MGLSNQSLCIMHCALYIDNDRKELIPMLILSRVCAEFRDRTGAVIHRVTPETRLSFREAPDAIREDPLFRMLVE